MSEDERFVPLRSLVGPFDFPIDFFRRKLQAGNQNFGDFARYESDASQSAKAFCHKKLMDVMLFIFDRLRNGPKRLVARKVYCLVRMRESAIAEGKDAEWLRNCGDLSDAYAAVRTFSFFIEVEKKTEGNDDVDDDVETDFKDLDDIVQGLYRPAENEEGATKPPPVDPAKKRKRGNEAFLAGKNQQGLLFNIDNTSSDLSETITSNFIFGQTICGAIGNYRVTDGDQQKDLRDLPYAPSRVFNLQALWERCGDGIIAEEERLPREFIAQTEVHGPCIDLCKGLSFGVLTEDFKRGHFGLLAFPDIRKTDEDYNLPIPDDDTMTAVVDIDMDMSVQAEGVSAFLATRQRLAPSKKAATEACKSNELSRKEKFDLRSQWQEQALVPYKSVFNERAAIAFSIKNMVKEWEQLNEKDHGPGQGAGIPVTAVRVKSYANLDRQAEYVAALYDLSETMGFYCHHSIFIAMLIDARFAVRKGDQKGPHTILFGGPGSGKSRILLLVQFLMQSDHRPVFCCRLSNMSRLSWAVADAKNPENPETCQTNIAIFWDEVPASFLGASDARRGEGDDTTAIMKEMLSAFTLSWRRNIEIVNADGTKGRGFEEKTISNEPVFFGGMNRAPNTINPAFRRRVCFKTCVQFERADKVTFEVVQQRDDATKDSEDRLRWVEGLRMNTRLNLLVAMAEYCGILLPPSLEIWFDLLPRFKAELNKYVTVQNFNDRLKDAETRITQLTRMIAIFETYQSGEDAVLSFDQIISKLPEVERRGIAGERLCTTVLSSLEDSCFPLMQKIILHAIIAKWPDLEDEAVDGIYMKNNEAVGNYARLPINAARPKNKEQVSECAARIVHQELRAIIQSETKRYKVDDSADNLSEAAVLELMSVLSPDHPVMVVKEDPSDQTISVFISLNRLKTVDVSVTDIIEKIARPGTQLMMMPHQSPKLPQFPSYMDDGSATGGITDEQAFQNRCRVLHLDPEEARPLYHHVRPDKPAPADNTQYPKDRVAALMSTVL